MFVVLYDINNDPFPIGGLVVFALAFLLIFGLVLPLRANGRTTRAISLIIGISLPLLALIMSLMAYFEHKDYCEQLATGNASVVEGKVRHFVREPRAGHGRESFSVGGQEFEYSHFDLTPGFNQSFHYGGPIREGIYVRIFHSRGRILRLEVRKEDKEQSPGSVNSIMSSGHSKEG